VREAASSRASDRTKYRRFDTVRYDFTERRLVHAQLGHCAGATARSTPHRLTSYMQPPRRSRAVVSNSRFEFQRHQAYYQLQAR